MNYFPRLFHTRGLGALINKSDADILYNDQLMPLYESFSALGADVDNAGFFVGKGAVVSALNDVYDQITSLDDRLNTMDASEVLDWKADVLATQQRLNTMTNQFAVYTQQANRTALYSTFIAVGVGALATTLVYRRKKSKKWTVFAGTGAAAAGGFGSWFLTRPKFE